MTMSRFDELVSMLLDDDLADEQIDELVAIVAEDPEKLQMLREHLSLSDRLSQYEDELRDDQRFLDALTLRVRTVDGSNDFVERVVASAQHSKAGAAATDTRASRLRSFGWLAAGIAAALAIILFVSQAGDRPTGDVDPRTGSVPGRGSDGSEEPLDNGVAVLTRAVGMQGADPTRWQPGATLPRGTLAWESGILQLEFYGGVTVIAEGPASIELVDESLIICRNGKLRVRVPEVARGFAVRAPAVEVVDRGTEFGVEVTQRGATSVHVFDGTVELFDAATNRDSATARELTAGEAVAVGVGGQSTAIATRDADFISSDRLGERTTAEDRHQLRRWQEFRERMKRDPRVVAFFPFEHDPAFDRTLIGYSGRGEVLHGAIVGCEWSEGRWPEKSSLDFKRPGDRVRIDIPGEYESLTYAAWLRLDALDREFNSLLLTDGFEDHRPHWQIHRLGCILLGLRRPGSATLTFRSDTVFDMTQLGRWVHVVTVVDTESSDVRHYVDGSLAGWESLGESNGALLTIGSAAIGNWGRPTDRHKVKIRNLNGRLDELIVFGEALTDAEVRLLHAAGRS